jgi:thiosulfate/3-mercaptopyruvate sulfurtransferase
MNVITRIAATLFFIAAAAANAKLVDGAWLEARLARGDVVLVDTSPGKAYAAGHIPGAHHFDLFSFGGEDAPAAELEKRFQALGVSPGKQVVMYDMGGTYFATNLWSDLYYAGFPADSLHVLDGGLAKWKADGRAVTQEATPKPAPGTFRVAALREDARVRLTEFFHASGDPAKHALVEALEPSQHFGSAKFFDRGGHVPGALLAPAGDFFNADKTFKSPAEIRKLLSYIGATPDKTMHAHCGGGIAATVPFFAAKELAAYPQVKLYKGSQLEWLRDDRNLPFWTYDQPNLVRDKSWLNGWNAPMVRMYGVSKVSVIDVRPAEGWGGVRVPFSTHVPAEVFRRHLGEPAKLAEALGAAGVDPSFEAVIVGAGGLTPDVALVYLALDQIGHKKVSTIAESPDDWGLAGLPTETAAGAKTTAAVKPTKYAPAPRSGLLVRETRAVGAYPKVYLATGAAPPTRTFDGKVVHVPYRQLLDDKGRVKPAGDVWTVLSKAGLPRYAEVVTVADDTGEAAVGYFVLKMMGWPDVKVLI